MKKIIDVVALIFLTVVVFVMLILLCSFLIERVLLPSDFLFYESSLNLSSLLVSLLAVPSFLAAYCVWYFIKKKITSVEDDFYCIVLLVKKLKKWNIAIIVVWIIAIYISLTGMTYVTNDKIVVVTPFNLKGEAYGYSDVQEIETGFGDKMFSFLEYKKEGSFYYIIKFNGRKAVFHTPSVNVNVDRYQDTYLELEEFDQALMKYNVPKKSSSEGYEKCGFDQRYVDRFLRIIESK